MKKIWSICLMAIGVSCTNLDEEVYTAISPQEFYRNAEDLNIALTSVYKIYQSGFGRNIYDYWMIIEAASETGAPSRTKDDPHLYNNWSYANNADMSIDAWSRAYQIINQANVVLGRGEGIEMDQTLKNRMFGEARFLRALSYFHLLRLYGGVPIPETFTQGLAGLEIPRKTADEVYAYIISDLEFAIENLSLKSAYNASNKWRTSKGAAQALLGKVYLYRGSMSGEMSYFQLSKDHLTQVINSGEYQLEPDFKDLWFWWNTNNKNGKESIFEIEFGYEGDGNDNRLHIDGGINQVDRNLGTYMFHRFGPSYTTYKSFSDQDARKEATFLTSLKLSSGQTITWKEADKGLNPGTASWPTPNPGNLKYYDRTEKAFTTERSAANIYVMRYAEVLLNYAEAENVINGPTLEAYNKINEVRTRAKLEPLDGLSKEQFDDAVYQERTFELLGEGHLYYDGLRTNRLGKRVKDEVTYGATNGWFIYSPLLFVPKKTFLWKIPTYDLNSNPALVQNPDNVSDPL
jgi:hypothetical protein